MSRPLATPTQQRLAFGAGMNQEDPLVRLPEEILLGGGSVPTVQWNIDNTIPELAYLTHNLFRYYGKFPSVIPRKLLLDFADTLDPDDYVLDNYMGSGTTLVEARLAGRPSVGVDLNPLGVLGARVKTRTYDSVELRDTWHHLRARLYRKAAIPTKLPGDRSRLHKWFSSEAAADLALLKATILELPAGDVREFFTLAFVGIVRRVSRAYDGEVRPHINPEKKPRSVLHAYGKKLSDMIDRSAAFSSLVRHAPPAYTYCANNRLLASLPLRRHGQCGIIITHPPYLNCFDYIPVYSLEFLWAHGFEELIDGEAVGDFRCGEIRSWPATDTTVFQSYFVENRAAFAAALPLLKRGGLCCVVIGDATIRKHLVPVHLRFVDMLVELGLKPTKLIYRTTHYGTGKYAYEGRADYHGESAKKRDAVLVFQKP